MSALADQLANERLDEAVKARAALLEATETHTSAYVRYVRDALDAGWSWKRIAAGIEISEAAVRRFWIGNRQRAGRLG